MATARADAEHFYGTKLKAIPTSLSSTKKDYNKHNKNKSSISISISSISSNISSVTSSNSNNNGTNSNSSSATSAGAGGNAGDNGVGSIEEGASLAQSLQGIVTEMAEEGNHHLKVAENIREMVILPFRKWTDDHKKRVNYSYNFLKSKVDAYNKDGVEAQKSQSKYFNKCRVYDISRKEDEIEKMQEGGGSAAETKHLGNDTSNEIIPSSNPTQSPGRKNDNSTKNEQKAKEEEEDDDDDDDYDEVMIGDIYYNQSELKVYLSKMLKEIPQKDVKIPIIGTYSHVSTGADIVSWLTSNSTQAGSVANAEKIGQDLISNGFLRLVGQVGSKFLNSSVQKYQWKKQAFIRAGLAEDEPSMSLERKGTELISSMAGEYLPDSISSSITNYLNTNNGSNGSNPHNPNETQTEKLEREVKELDKKCHAAITKYDDSRMELEEMIINHFDFMQRCENDRLKAIKTVLLDFTASISNKVASLKSTIDKYLLYQESVVPERDLRYLVELNKTGFFAPKVPCYDNYYVPSKGWTFGGDLEVRAKGDGKRIPLIVSTILKYLDQQYPSMQDDEKWLGIWTVKVPLEETHKLRKEINTGEAIPKEVLDKYQPPVIANCLKLYFLELPDSLVPSKYYDYIKNIYSMQPASPNLSQGNTSFSSSASTSSSSQPNSEQRIQNIQHILKDCCKLSSVMTIDALAKHLERLMQIAQPEESYKTKLAQELGILFLRPKQQQQYQQYQSSQQYQNQQQYQKSSVTMDDRHPYLLVRDILENRELIFEDIRRQSLIGSRKNSSASRKSSVLGQQAGPNTNTANTTTRTVSNSSWDAHRITAGCSRNVSSSSGSNFAIKQEQASPSAPSKTNTRSPLPSLPTLPTLPPLASEQSEFVQTYQPNISETGESGYYDDNNDHNDNNDEYYGSIAGYYDSNNGFYDTHDGGYDDAGYYGNHNDGNNFENHNVDIHDGYHNGYYENDENSAAYYDRPVLSRQSSFVNESETKHFHATPVLSNKLMQTSINNENFGGNDDNFGNSNGNKRESIVITGVSERVKSFENGTVNDNGKRFGSNGGGFGGSEVLNSARRNELLTTNKKNVPANAEVIEVDDD